MKMLMLDYPWFPQVTIVIAVPDQIDSSFEGVKDSD